MASPASSNVLVVVALVGCAAAPRDEAAPTPDAAPFCGDGVVPPIGSDPHEDVGQEYCDDGPRTGTPDSLCTKQCKPATIPFPYEFRHMYLGFRPTAATGIQPAPHGGDIFDMAFIPADGSGLVIARLDYQDLTPLDDSTPIVRGTFVHVPTPAPPVALGTFALAHSEELPIWVEAPRPGETAPRMYYATLDDDLVATVHEIPYPFPDGTAPKMRSYYGVDGLGDRHAVLLVDQSRTPPYDVLVAMVAVRSPTDVTASTLRIPAPGRVRGAAVFTEAGALPNWVIERQVVQFFEDTNTFVAISARPTSGVGSEEVTTYTLTEVTRGSWPHRVVTGAQWYDGCTKDGSFQYPPDPITPTPVALLTDTGDIYTLHFAADQTAEQFVGPYGHVAPGTNALIVNVGPTGTTWTWDPDGTFVVLVDGDCRDLQSTALRPQRFPGVGPWTTMFAPEPNKRALVVDDWLVFHSAPY